LLNPYHISRITLAIIWLHHGIVPKLIFKDEQEVLMNNTLIPFLSEQNALLYSGIAEVIYGLLILVLYNSKLVIIPSVIFSVLVTVVLLVYFPSLFTKAFNPFSINISVFALACINLSSCPPSRATNKAIKQMGESTNVE
jgi:hypothetical protein